MSMARTARRRRLQAVQGNKHVAKLGRRIYRIRSAESARRRLAEVIATERRMAQGKGKRK